MTAPLPRDCADVLAVLEECRVYVEVESDFGPAYDEALAAVAQVYAQRAEYAARLQEDRAILDAIRDAAGGGPYDTIARRVTEVYAQRDALLLALASIQAEIEANEDEVSAVRQIEWLAGTALTRCGGAK